MMTAPADLAPVERDSVSSPSATWAAIAATVAIHLGLIPLVPGSSTDSVVLLIEAAVLVVAGSVVATTSGRPRDALVALVTLWVILVGGTWALNHGTSPLAIATMLLAVVSGTYYLLHRMRCVSSPEVRDEHD